MIAQTTEADKHYHVIYYSETDKAGITSKDKGHVHLIQQDEQGNLLVAPAKDHTHEQLPLEEIEIDLSSDKLSEDDEHDVAHDLYTTAMEGDSDSYDYGKTSEEYYMGDQWSKADRAKLETDGRACLTINEIKAKIDMLSGHQRQNRSDIKLMPVESGDSTVADMYNFVIKNVCTQNDYDYEETAGFDDALIAGRGGIQIEIDSENEITGRIKAIQRAWDNVFFGQHKLLDGSDAEYAGMWEWKSLSQIKQLYPDKADDVQIDYDIISDNEAVPRDPSEYYNRQVGKRILASTITSKDSDLFDLSEKQFRLVEVQRRVYKKTPIVMRARDNFYILAESLSKANLKKFKTIENLLFINSASYKIRTVVFSGNVLLHRQDSLFSEINIVPIYGNKRKGKWWGKVKEVIDPQDELNKRHSQAVDIINKMSSYGLGISPDAFESPKDYQEFLENRMKPGFVAKLKAGGKNEIYEFQGVKYPNEVVATSEMNSQKISTIMNVHPELMGARGEATSGVAIAQKIRQGLVGNERYFDNLSLSKRRIGKLLVEAIQTIYSPEKILRLTEQQDSIDPVELSGQELYPQIGMEEKIQLAQQQQLLTPQAVQDIVGTLQEGGEIDPEIQQLLDSMQLIANQIRRDGLLRMLENEDVLKYDVVVSESPYSPTVMFSNFVLMKELAQGGVAIPPQMLIDLMPNLTVNKKKEINAAITAQTQAQQQQDQAKIDSEVQKTLIANQPEPGAQS